MPSMHDNKQGSRLFRSAMRYAEVHRWPVFPLKRRDKQPVTEHGFKDATRDTAQIGEWWRKWPTANIGIPTGQVFWVLDVDPRHGGDDTLESLVLKHGPLPKTMQQMSGGGGKQFMFAVPDQMEIGSRTAILPGIDIKGIGGYIVAPPSIHPSGKEYIWDCAEPPEDQPILPAPDWLLDLVVSANQNNHAGKIQAPDRIPKGNQHTTLFKLGCSMRRNGFGEAEIFAALWEANRTRCEQPGPEDNIRKLAASICSQYEAGATEKKAAQGQQPESFSAAVSLDRVKPTLELLNGLAVLQGIQFREVKRRGSMVIATTAEGAEVIWPSAKQLSSFHDSRALIADATGVFLRTPPQRQIRASWEPFAHLLLRLAAADEIVIENVQREEIRDLLRLAWTATKQATAADSEMFIEFMRSIRRECRNPTWHWRMLEELKGTCNSGTISAKPIPPCVFIAEEAVWVNVPALRMWLSIPALTNKLYPLADIRNGLLLLGFKYCENVSRGYQGDSETACLWRGPLEVLGG